MTTRIAWILLAASLGFNGFFAAGYIRARHTAELLQSFEGRARLFAGKLKLDGRQQAVFERMLAEAARERAESRRARLPQVRMFLAELGREQPDEQALLDYADQDPTRACRRTITLMMRDFMAELTPAQKQVFIQALERKADSDS